MFRGVFGSKKKKSTNRVLLLKGNQNGDERSEEMARIVNGKKDTSGHTHTLALALALEVWFRQFIRKSGRRRVSRTKREREKEREGGSSLKAQYWKEGKGKT